MPTQVMTRDEKVKVLDRIRPVGDWKEPEPSALSPGLNQPIEWENKIPLDEWREHPRMQRKILPALKDEKKSASVASSIQIRLRKLFPNESWICVSKKEGIFLKFNGERQQRQRRSAAGNGNGNDSGNGDLFAA